MAAATMKRPLEDDGDVHKPSKLSKAELYMPPTNDELNNLRETENLYQSSLFRMQIKELLNEVSPKDKRNREIDNYVKDFTTFLKKIPEGKEYKLMDQSWCKDFAVPIDQKGPPVQGLYCFKPPTNVEIVGSHSSGTIIKPCAVDVVVTMPKSCFQASDFMNHRYHRKRALYLVRLAQHLNKFPAVEKMEFQFHLGDRWKPVLVLTPSGKFGKHVTIILHTSVESGTFKLSRFHVNKNSIRSKWYNQTTESGEDPPTPVYNTACLRDLLNICTNQYINKNLEDLDEVKKGLQLLRVWLRQRQLDQAGISGHLLTMYVIYLIKKRKLTKLMSSYQIFRNTLLILGESGFETGITLCDEEVEGAPTLDEFLQASNLVFVDQTGWLNLASTVAPSTYEWLQYESRRAIAILQEDLSDSFTSLFMVKMPFLHRFDYIFHLADPAALSSCTNLLNLQNDRMDRNDVVSAALPKLVELLRRGLGQRVTSLAYQIIGQSTWSVKKAPPGIRDQQLRFGYCVDPDFYTSVLDKGPPADDSEAPEFQRFWGEKSELRRFQDASIREAVVWKADTMADRRLVCLQIISYLLHRHAGVPPNDVVHHCDKLDPLLTPAQKQHKPIVYGTGEEQNLAVLRAYDTVSKCLRKLRDLPLTIDSVRGASPVFSLSDVFPSVLHTKNRIDHQQRPLNERETPCTYTPILDIICTVEASGHWPENREAIRRLKAAFYIKLSEMLRAIHTMTSYAFPDHVAVVQDGHHFRIKLGLTREVAVLKMVTKQNGMVKMMDTDEAVALERDVIKRPLIRSSLHAVQDSHATYTLTCRLLKRWLCGQLLARHVPDLVVDLLSAYVYVHTGPYATAPRSGISGFLRVLNLLTHWDWNTAPLVVNFNNALNPDDLAEIHNKFNRERASLPLMYLITPHDRQSVFTKHCPTVPILQRLVLLAGQTLTGLENLYGSTVTTKRQNDNFKQLFRGSTQIYDVVINLDPKMLSRGHLAIEPDTKSELPHLAHRVAQPKLLVSSEFDPAQSYVNQLEDAYGDLALFFHDPLGGAVVGVVWKQVAMETKQFKVCNMAYHRPDESSSAATPNLVPNMEAILEDFEILGRGLVKDVIVKE